VPTYQRSDPITLWKKQNEHRWVDKKAKLRAKVRLGCLFTTPPFTSVSFPYEPLRD
jgi:hypothetical protein